MNINEKQMKMPLSALRNQGIFFAKSKASARIDDFLNFKMFYHYENSQDFISTREIIFIWRGIGIRSNSEGFFSFGSRFAPCTILITKLWRSTTTSYIGIFIHVSTDLRTTFSSYPPCFVTADRSFLHKDDLK